MALEKDTVQQTLCIPMWSRAANTKAQPNFFPNYDAQRILDELGQSEPPSAMYKLQYAGVSGNVRQYDMACEVANYVKTHPQACIVDLGCGLSCLRRQMVAKGMTGATNPWYVLDLPDVIELRKQLVPDDGVETCIAADLTDFAWMDQIDFAPERGVIFLAAGLFYYFLNDQVKELVVTLAERFPGGALAFDATNKRGLGAVNKMVKTSGNETQSYFFLENTEAEIKAWNPRIANVEELDYFRSYATPNKEYQAGPLTGILINIAKRGHLSFMVHVDFSRLTSL